MSDSLLLRIGVPLGLFIIMFGLGTTLDRRELLVALKSPNTLFAGLTAQLLLLPAVGFLIAWAAPIPIEFKFGIIILACCPGGTTSNIFTHLAKGNLALSVSLTAISSLLALITMPVMLSAGALLLAQQSFHFDVPQGEIFKSLIAVTILPVGLGMWFRYRYPRLAERVESGISVFSSLFLLALVLMIGINEHAVLLQHLPSLGPVLITLSAASMLLGVALTRVAKGNATDALTVGLEAGIQNSGLAIFIALALIENELMTVPAAVYSISMYLCASVMIWIGRRQARSPQAATDPI